MKKLVGLLLMLACVATCFADGSYAKVRLNIKLPTTVNAYFLCIANEGCLSIKAGDQGTTFPLFMTEMSNLNKFVITDVTHNMEMHAQLSPASCDVNVKDNQTLTITGSLVATKNDQVYVQNLQCHVA